MKQLYMDRKAEKQESITKIAKKRTKNSYKVFKDVQSYKNTKTQIQDME